MPRVVVGLVDVAVTEGLTRRTANHAKKFARSLNSQATRDDAGNARGLEVRRKDQGVRMVFLECQQCCGVDIRGCQSFVVGETKSFIEPAGSAKKAKQIHVVFPLIVSRSIVAGGDDDAERWVVPAQSQRRPLVQRHDPSGMAGNRAASASEAPSLGPMLCDEAVVCYRALPALERHTNSTCPFR